MRVEGGSYAPQNRTERDFYMKKHISDATRYFHQKDILRPIGAVLLPAGLLVIYFGGGFVGYILGALAVPLGLAFFIIGGAKYVSDNDVAELLDHATLGYDRVITELPSYERIVLKHPAPFEIVAYSFGEDATCFKRGKNSTPVSDRYTRAHIFYTKDALWIVGRIVSLTGMDEAAGKGIENIDCQFLFDHLTAASLEMHETPVTWTNTGKTATVKWYELVLTGEDGELLRIPARNDMDVTDLVDEVNRRAERRGRA